MALKSLSTQDIQDKEKLVLREVLRPEACMQFMRPGRLLHVRDGPVDWAWGVLVRPRREAREDQSLRTGVENVTYVMDVLLICSLKSSESRRRLLLLLPPPPPPPPCESEFAGHAKGELYLTLAKAWHTFNTEKPPAF